MSDESVSDWRSIETAPRDSTVIIGEYEDGIDTICWLEQRYCIIGAPQGSFGPGFVTIEPGHLPTDPPLRWKPAPTPTPPEPAP